MQSSQDFLRVAELFAGVGGFRLGLSRAGLSTVWSNQWEPSTSKQHASECYLANFGPEGHVCEDVAQVLNEIEAGTREKPEFELLVGGFPCQDYSVARTLSHALGIAGKKGVLWWEIVRLIRLSRPPYLFLENVDRLLKSPSTQRGRDFAIMLACLGELGYHTEWRTINAADYGYPQKRRRVFIVAYCDPPFEVVDPCEIIFHTGVLARAFPVEASAAQRQLGDNLGLIPDIELRGDIADISDCFDSRRRPVGFQNAGFCRGRSVWTRRVTPDYNGKRLTLGDALQGDDEVSEEYYIEESDLETWRYLKGAKRQVRAHRASSTGYVYAEGAIPSPRLSSLVYQGTPISSGTNLGGKVIRTPP